MHLLEETKGCPLCLSAALLTGLLLPAAPSSAGSETESPQAHATLAQLRPVPGLVRPPPATPKPQSRQEAGPTQRPAVETPEQNKFYDPDNPDYRTLQKSNESLAGFPVDRQGYVDWMRALQSGTIRPLSALKGGEAMVPLDMDVVMKNTKEMPNVVFPHRSHTLWLDCSNCHPGIFVPQAGANKISMAEIFRGRYCGVCHDRVAFITFFSCDRCHRGPSATPPQP